MIRLTNDSLTVEVLHPVDDKSRLGSRYCTGGYIWQVYDSEGTPLLSGPCYPDTDPPPFHGQGLPEAFSLAPGADEVQVGKEALVIGVGMVRKSDASAPFTARHNPEVGRLTEWEIRELDTRLEMETEQEFGPWKIELRRSVSVAGCTVVSKTTLANRGSESLPVRWFAHPFFPIPRDFRVCRFEVPLSMEANPGFLHHEETEIRMNSSYPWKNGHFQPIVLLPDFAFPATGTSIPHRRPEGELPSAGASGSPPRGMLTVTQYHDLVKQIHVQADFWPSFLPIWANENTVSFEPYREGIVPVDHSKEWSISYRIGAHT